MKNLSLVALVGSLFVVGCQSMDNTKEGQEGLGTNAVRNEAQNTTGEPHYPASNIMLPKKAAAVTPAPVAAPAPAVVVVKHDRCVATALSSGAVGMPCETTVEFIDSLNLSKKQQKLAIMMVRRADREFTTNVAH